MIANVNDKPVPGAMCRNCGNELRSLVIETNKGKQAMYICENENCKLREQVTVGYKPPAITQPAA